MTVLDVTILSVTLCDPIGLYLNFLGSQPSLAAQMSSLRSDDKVCSTSWKSEWTWQACTCFLGWGQGAGKVPAMMAQLNIQVHLGSTPFLYPHTTQARALQRMGWEGKSSVLSSLCLSQGPAKCCPPVRQPVTPLPAKPALGA